MLAPLLLLVTLPMLPPAKTPREHDASAAPTFALTVAGGISLGAYEAGVNWALVRSLKRPLADGRAPRMTAVTGASAGNINAFLSAIAWCQKPEIDVHETVETNWFFRTWMDVGVQTLLPDSKSCRDAERLLNIDEHDSRCPGWTACRADERLRGVDEAHSECDEGPTYNDDDGLLSRRAFDAIELALTKHLEPGAHPPTLPEYDPACLIDVGLTATKAAPVRLTLDPYGTTSAPAQRYVAAFRASIKGNGDVFTFERWQDADVSVDDDTTDDVVKDANGEPLPLSRLGPTLRLPMVDPNNQQVALRSIFDLVSASSAFPVAFGTKTLQYCVTPSEAEYVGGGDTVNLPPTLTCGPGLSPREARYLDGGFFDNEPLGLALHLHDNRRNAEPDDVRLLFIDPDGRRPMARPPEDASELRGLGMFATFVPDFVEVARNYEQQVLRRHESARLDLLRPTSRYGSIFGDHLGAFGAFLGRSFREYDFYVGVYDGLVQAAATRCEWMGEAAVGASAELCHARELRSGLEALTTTEVAAIAREQRPDAVQQGVEQRSPGLILDGFLQPSDVEDTHAVTADLAYVVRGLACDESALPSPVPASAERKAWACEKVKPHRQVFRAYLAAQRELQIEEANALANREEPLSMFDRFDRLMAILREKDTEHILGGDERVRAHADAERPWLEREIPRTRAMVASPTAALIEESRDLLTRASELEQKDESSATLNGVRAAQIGLESFAELKRDVGFYGFPRGTPQTPTGYALFWVPTRVSLVPNQAGLDGQLDMVGFQFGALGPMRPALIAGIVGTTREGLWHVTAGPQAHLALKLPTTTWWAFSRVEVGYRWNLDPVRIVRTRGMDPSRGHCGEVAAVVAADRLRLGLACDDAVGLFRGDILANTMVLIGVNDVAGLAYWFTRWGWESFWWTLTGTTWKVWNPLAPTAAIPPSRDG